MALGGVLIVLLDYILTLQSHYLKFEGIYCFIHSYFKHSTLFALGGHCFYTIPACTCLPPAQLTTLRLQYVVPPGCAIGGATGTANTGTALILTKCTFHFAAFRDAKISRRWSSAFFDGTYSEHLPFTITSEALVNPLRCNFLS